jgi:hypothetical protein
MYFLEGGKVATWVPWKSTALSELQYLLLCARPCAEPTRVKTPAYGEDWTHGHPENHRQGQVTLASTLSSSEKTSQGRRARLRF